MIVPLVTGTAVAFWLLAPIIVLAAIGMVMARKPVHSALGLATVMVGLAVQYAAQQAPFLFAVQIIVYTGAALMLFLFVLMLVGVDSTDSLVETLRGQRLAAGLAAFGLGALLVGVMGNAIVEGQVVGYTPEVEGNNVQQIAYAVFGRWIFIFETTAALLITAALAAMVLAHRERIGGRLTQRRRALLRMRKYAEDGTHPGSGATPGVYARHNAVDTPALLPDGSAAESSVSTSLAARGDVVDAHRLAAATKWALDEIDGEEPVGDERQVLGTGPTARGEVDTAPRAEVGAGDERSEATAEEDAK
ncbi:NADH dehydrogenase subunit J [Propioniferax innocua]|uniref:NADH-quinone oxidoreductase subunit J n=1 Tax=Propioniferax innocua TaxID=1753 RepID=A0A542ZD30_9ACTN|nr:NADH dehydrogenase subunit J [Propioniferax innocua]